jgi:hypothetical protein
METAEALVVQVQQHVTAALGSVVGYGVVFMVGGLALGGAAVWVGRRMGLFEREPQAWSLLARLNVVYVPVVCAVCGALAGGIYGAQTATHRWIDASTEPVVAYARAYVPHVQATLDEALADAPGETLTVEEAVARVMRIDGVLATRPVARAVLRRLNVAVLDYALAQVPGGAEAGRFVRDVGRMDLRRLDPAAFDRLPRALHEAANRAFAPAYAAVVALFTLAMLLPALEGLLYRAVRAVRRRRA